MDEKCRVLHYMSPIEVELIEVIVESGTPGLWNVAR